MPIPRDQSYTGPVGLDLEDRGLVDEVTALVRSSPAFSRGLDHGLDREDLYQLIWLRIVTRQRGRSAFDRRRASLSSYVRMVTRSVVTNQIDSRRRRWWEAPGAREDAAVAAQGVGRLCPDCRDYFTEKLDG